MNRKILITGGAGFIGSHLADELLAHDYEVRVLDNLAPQVHGHGHQRPDYLHGEVELIRGDVRDPGKVRKALQGCAAVFHFAALMAGGHSFDEMTEYNEINNLGTVNLLHALIERPVERLIVASSMSLYGEGLYRSPDGTLVSGPERTLSQLKAGDWEPRNAQGQILTPVPTPETKPPAFASVYALSKYHQEQLCLLMGREYQIPVVGLRFFNVYGPRQNLGNPYTGVLAHFASRLLNGHPPVIFEDGMQRRDFVSVHDAARAARLALESPGAPGRTFNIGSGRNNTVREIAQRLCDVLGCDNLEPEISGKFRPGDTRHCFADIRLAREVLNYEPLISFAEGLPEMACWLERQVVEDCPEDLPAELCDRCVTA